jgi:hypothetical protein
MPTLIPSPCLVVQIGQHTCQEYAIWHLDASDCKQSLKLFVFTLSKNIIIFELWSNSNSFNFDYQL